jgi:hypothetical protein
MKAAYHALAALAACAALSSTLMAQWPGYPAYKTPKKANGEFDLTAPAPRTADGKPDLSGVWRGAPAGGGRRGAPPPEPAPGTPPLATFNNVASTFKDGLPLTPYASDLLAKRKARNSKDNPEASCLPMGIMQFWTQGFPRKFVQTPGLIVILYEASSGIRQIFTDGRALPAQGDPQPWYYGYSSGKWEGDTLVVETNNLRDDGWLDIVGTPLTDQARITERFRRVNFGRMEIDITVNDPKAYTKPWTVRHAQDIMPDTDIIEFICEENNHFTPNLGGGK